MKDELASTVIFHLSISGATLAARNELFSVVMLNFRTVGIIKLFFFLSENLCQMKRFWDSNVKDMRVFGTSLNVELLKPNVFPLCAIFTTCKDFGGGGETSNSCFFLLFPFTWFMMTSFVILIVPSFFNAVPSLQCSHLMYLSQA